MSQKRFKLFANCIPVQGASRSIICDLQRQDYQLIPNSLYTLLRKFPEFTLDELIAHYGHEEKETLLGYLSFLETHEFGTWLDKSTAFASLNLNWNSPSKITNSIIDWHHESNYDFATVFQALNSLHCQYLQLRFFDAFDYDKLIQLLELLNQSCIVSVEIFIPFNSKISTENYRTLLNKFRRITRLIIHGAPENKHFNGAEDVLNLVALSYIQRRITDESHCGVIHPGYFSPNLHHFSEAQHFNTCLNRKISVDKNGSICNCPSLPKKYGKVGKISLVSVADQEDFKRVWKVNKDQIEVCKDCEFRYICSDCRAYTNENEPLQKPVKCNYDPYSGQWN